MPKARKKEFYEVKNHFTIFAFVDEINNECFVWKTKNKNLKSVFEVHYQLRNTRTREMFERGKRAGTPPGMYLLDAIENTEAVAFKHCIAWTKYFMGYGYESKNHELHKGYTEYLDEETQAIYDMIREQFLSDVCCNENRLFAEYGTQRKKKDKNTQSTQITIKLSPEEYNRILQDAKKLAIAPSAYVKNMALEGEIKRENYEFFLEYKEKLGVIERRMRGILKTIYDTGRYYPADLQNLQKLCDQIIESNREVVRIFRRRKYSRRTRRNK